MEPPRPLPAPWRAGLAGARAHVAPGLALQTAALGLVLLYYFWPPAHAAVARLLEFRRRTGVPFAMASTAVFGGLLPFLYMRWRREPGLPPRYTWIQGWALTAFWAYKGFEIGLFYRLQAWIFGPGHDAATIVRKALLDQLVYSPVLAVPLMIAVYGWIDADFDLGAALADLRQPRWYARRSLPALISNFGVWAPTVAIIYLLPTPLQLPLQNLVLCFYTLIIAHQTRPGAESQG